MERIVLELGMFETLALAVLAIYFGEFLRKQFPVLKRYCLPAAVVGGFNINVTIFYKYL